MSLSRALASLDAAKKDKQASAKLDKQAPPKNKTDAQQDQLNGHEDSKTKKDETPPTSPTRSHGDFISGGQMISLEEHQRIINQLERQHKVKTLEAVARNVIKTTSEMQNLASCMVQSVQGYNEINQSLDGYLNQKPIDKDHAKDLIILNRIHSRESNMTTDELMMHNMMSTFMSGIQKIKNAQIDHIKQLKILSSEESQNAS